MQQHKTTTNEYINYDNYGIQKHRRFAPSLLQRAPLATVRTNDTNDTNDPNDTNDTNDPNDTNSR